MYGKIFESIYKGSLYGQFEAIVTFQAMIILADECGLIDISPQALAAQTSTPIEIIRKGLKILQQSDPHSRSSAEDGKRIVLLDEDREFGWRIVNYEYYRDLGKRSDTRERARERKRKQRAQVIDSVGPSQDVTPPSQNVTPIGHTNTNTNTNNNIFTLNKIAWKQYEAYRVERKASKLTVQGVKIKQTQLCKISPEEQQACVENTISNGWTGLFPEKRGGKNAAHRSTNEYDDKLKALRTKAGLD